MRLAYVIPCFGEHDFTDAVLTDILDQNTSSDVFLIDNKGDYDLERIERDYRSNYDTTIDVVDGEERRWLKGTNFGTELAQAVQLYDREYDAFVWLNNDVRLSPFFTQGLHDALLALGPLCGLLAPSYDDVWPQQHCGYSGPAQDYLAPPIGDHEHTVKFVDGACMVVPRNTWEEIGPMDERFWQYGWGGDLDYCLRVRESGKDIWVTDRSYFNHLGGGTNKLLEENYQGLAGSEMHTGMFEKYGAGWEERLRDEQH